MFKMQLGCGEIELNLARLTSVFFTLIASLLTACQPTMAPVMQPDPATVLEDTQRSETADLPLSITVGSASPAIVSRYVVSYSYLKDASSIFGSSSEFSSDGGSITSVIRSHPSEFPDSVNISMAVDFTPESGIEGFVRQETYKIDPLFGVAAFFEPSSEELPVDVFLHTPSRSFFRRIFCGSMDYITIRTTRNTKDEAFPTLLTLSGAMLDNQPFHRLTPVFPPTGVRADSYNVEVRGRFNARPIAPFQLDLASAPFIAELRLVTSKDGYYVQFVE